MRTFSHTQGQLPTEEQAIIDAGFQRHSDGRKAPKFSKTRLNWLARSEEGHLVGAVTADVLWDWLYVDELWVDESARGTGLGKQLMRLVEEHAVQAGLTGVWLWTQSWQAADFYKKLGYEEFTRFPDFPRGHERIGFRKTILHRLVNAK